MTEEPCAWFNQPSASSVLSLIRFRVWLGGSGYRSRSENHGYVPRDCNLSLNMKADVAFVA